MASPKGDGSPAALAERAALIQRAYVAAERRRNSVDLLLAEYSGLPTTHRAGGRAGSFAASPAEQLARQAGQLAERAGRIQRAFVVLQRGQAPGVKPGESTAGEAPAKNTKSRKAAALRTAGGKRGASKTVPARKAGAARKSTRRKRGQD
jgi:hypothetical protein